MSGASLCRVCVAAALSALRLGAPGCLSRRAVGAGFAPLCLSPRLRRGAVRLLIDIRRCFCAVAGLAVGAGLCSVSGGAVVAFFAVIAGFGACAFAVSLCLFLPCGFFLPCLRGDLAGGCLFPWLPVVLGGCSVGRGGSFVLKLSTYFVKDFFGQTYIKHAVMCIFFFEFDTEEFCNLG